MYTDSVKEKMITTKQSQVPNIYQLEEIEENVFKVINIYPSQKSIQREVGWNQGNIQKAIKKHHTAYGYFWVSENEIKNCREQAKNYQNNANLAYLEAVYLAREQQDSYSQLVKAKDADCIPFRCRSRLTSELERKCSVSNSKNLFYIPTSAIMKKDEILPDNKFFADHLHFSIEGNRWIALQAATVLQSIFNLEKDKVFKIFTLDTEDFYSQFPLSELDRYRVASSVLSLIENEPFASMLIPYYPEFPVNNKNIVTSDAALYRTIRDCKQEDFYLNACAYFLRSGKYIQARETAQSFVKCFPANAKARDFLSQSLKALGFDKEADYEKNISLSLE